jgi:hypothetical protein
MNQINPYVLNIVAKVQNLIIASIEEDAKKANRRAKRPIFTSDTLIRIAKECSLIEGRRGRGDGFYPTDAGLEFVGQDVAVYREQEEKEKQKKEEERKQNQRLLRDQKKQVFNTSLMHTARTLGQQS